MTLRDLCLSRTDLSEKDILLLEQYASVLPSLADLSAGDAFIDCMDRTGTAFVVAQAIPKYVPSKYENIILGMDADPSNEPAVYRAFSEKIPFHDTIANTQENQTVLQDVAPVMNGKKLIAVLILEHDITRLVSIEKKLSYLEQNMMSDPASVPEKPNVFSVRESNHRIKNDLQLISSIARIRARDSSSEEERLAYEDCSAMVMSVAQLHGLFIGIADSNYDIDLRTLLERLTEGIHSTIAKEKGVTIELTADALQIPPDIAASITICVNELILNSLKYAFDSSGGTIVVQANSGNRYCSILVRDDGCGADVIRPGVGLTLVEDTVRNKLGGELIISSGPDGTKAVFTFPVLN